MKNSKIIKYFTLIFFTAHVPLLSSSSTSNPDYFEGCSSQGLSSTLIVGCGHKNFPEIDGNHYHSEAYCVDIVVSGQYAPRWHSEGVSEPITECKTPFWRNIAADEELDITSIDAGVRFKERFDTVVLERLYSTVLSMPYTLYNATHMLKSGGILLIDVHTSYSFHDFSLSDETSLTYQISNSSEAPKQLNFNEANFYNRKVSLSNFLDEMRSMGSEVDGDLINALLNRLGFNSDNRPTRYDNKYDGLISYLNEWGFTNVIFFPSTLQPYTFDANEPSIKGRVGDFIVAMKTDTTSKSMKTWKGKIMKYKKK